MSTRVLATVIFVCFFISCRILLSVLPTRELGVVSQLVFAVTVELRSAAGDPLLSTTALLGFRVNGTRLCSGALAVLVDVFILPRFASFFASVTFPVSLLVRLDVEF